MMNKTLEVIKDLIPLSSGIGMALGYICALFVISPFFAVFIPYNDVSIEIQEPIFENKIIGKVPKNHPVGGEPRGYRSIEMAVPVLSVDGYPIMKKIQQSFHGRGTPKIVIEDVSEITVPKMGNPPYIIEKKIQTEAVSPGAQRFKERVPDTERLNLFMFYMENIKHEGTGVYYVKKKVQFDIGIDPKEWSIFGGIIGTILSFFYFVKKHFCVN